jgi:hypothetical protein
LARKPNGPPELWHFEDVVWLRRSRLGSSMRRCARGEDPHALVIAEASDLSQADVDTFWNDVVPGPVARHRQGWAGIRQSVTALRDAHGRDGAYRLSRIAGRYEVLLLARLEPLFLDRGIAPVFGNVKASLDVKSYFHLRLLTAHVIGMGRDAYDAVMSDPASAQAHVPSLTMPSGGVFLALFGYEDLVYQSHKLRLLDAFTKFDGRPEPSVAQRQAEEARTAMVERLFGAVEFIEFVKTQFLDDEDVLDVPEELPRFTILDSTEVVRAVPPG